MSKNFYDLFLENRIDDLLNLDGIGETQINSIRNFFSNKTNRKVLNELKNMLSIDNFIEPKKDGLLRNKTFMLTGKLNGISRAEAKSIIEKNSGSIISNVSKKLDFLVVGEKPTKKKVDRAKELKVKILSQSDLLKMINMTS